MDDLWWVGEPRWFYPLCNGGRRWPSNSCRLEALERAAPQIFKSIPSFEYFLWKDFPCSQLEEYVINYFKKANTIYTHSDTVCPCLKIPWCTASSQISWALFNHPFACAKWNDANTTKVANVIRNKNRLLMFTAWIATNRLPRSHKNQTCQNVGECMIKYIEKMHIITMRHRKHLLARMKTIYPIFTTWALMMDNLTFWRSF